LGLISEDFQLETTDFTHRSKFGPMIDQISSKWNRAVMKMPNLKMDRKHFGDFSDGLSVKWWLKMRLATEARCLHSISNGLMAIGLTEIHMLLV